MSFPGALLPTCEQVDPLCKGGHGTERPRSRGLCYHVRLRGPVGSAAAGAANPVKQRWPEAGPRGRPEGGQRLARGVGWRGAQPVGGHHGGPGGQSRFPHTSGKDHPKGTGSFSVAHNVGNINGLLWCCHSNQIFKKVSSLLLYIRCCKTDIKFSSTNPKERKGKLPCAVAFFN